MGEKCCCLPSCLLSLPKSLPSNQALAWWLDQRASGCHSYRKLPFPETPHLLLSMSFYVSPHHLSLFFLSPPAVLVFNLPSPSLSLRSHQKPEQWQRCNYHRGSWYPRGGLTAWNGSAENNTKMLYSCKNIDKKMKSCCHVCFWLCK